jgi:hypothetical protein
MASERTEQPAAIGGRHFAAVNNSPLQAHG